MAKALNFKFFLLITLFLLGKPLWAQKLILYTDNDSYGKVGHEKSWIIARGEPAFANFFDLKVPLKFFLLDPTGKKQKLTLLRRELFDPWFNTKRISYETRIKPETKGDYLLCVEGDDSLTSEKKVQKGYARAIFHVEREGKWDSPCGFELEIIPYTRPYGLKKGALFRGRALYEGEPLKEALIEVERLRLKLSPQEILKDSTGEVNVPIYSKKVKTDERGYFYTNFEEGGWWVLALKYPRGVKRYGNQDYPYEMAFYLWLYVFDKPKK